MDFRKRIKNNFRAIVGREVETGDTGYNPKRAFNEKYGWYSVIYLLAGGDFTKMNEVTNKPFKQALVWLTYEADMREIENNKLT